MFGVAKKSDEKQILDRGRMSASRGRCAVLLGNANDAVTFCGISTSNENDSRATGRNITGHMTKQFQTFRAECTTQAL
jgi:RNase P protein component